MKYSVCIDAVFNGKDFIESMKIVKNIGIDAFELWCWWDKDMDKILKTKEDLGMNITAFCTKFISLVDPSKRNEYLECLNESIMMAQKMQCKTLISQIGDELDGVSRETQHRNIVKGLRECVPILEESGITLAFEPLNTLVDHKGYYLYSSDEAFGIFDEVGSKKVKVLYDIYHQQIMEGNLITRITKNIEKIGHFHAAGNPGRHELHSGEINYKQIFNAIDEAGYNGYIGLEYFPLDNAEEGLKRLLK